MFLWLIRIIKLQEVIVVEPEAVEPGHRQPAAMRRVCLHGGVAPRTPALARLFLSESWCRARTDVSAARIAMSGDLQRIGRLMFANGLWTIGFGDCFAYLGLDPLSLGSSAVTGNGRKTC